jgi:predicted ATP-binding protein involved in virulence
MQDQLDLLPMRGALRLKSIEIQNYRAIEYAHVDLNPHLTVLVGDNAAGKTAILDAIAAALNTMIGGSRQALKSVAVKDFRVIGKADQLGEVQRENSIHFKVHEMNNGGWECSYHLNDRFGDNFVNSVSDVNDVYRFRDRLRNEYFFAPVVASYGADRASPAAHRRNTAFLTKRQIAISRAEGYDGALESRAVYDEAVEWFEALENYELRSSREVRGYRDSRLDAVRKAVSMLVPELENLRMVGLPPRLMIDASLPGRPIESLFVDQLSGGYRVMLALVIDLARRMATLNPQLENPLSAEGIVLIDEIDLHLHPRWQQLVVRGLRTVFPAVQFILTTHSPQVLTTLEPENVLSLRWIDGRLVQDEVLSTSGAESGRLMSEVMGVDERPPPGVSDFVRYLDEYRRLIKQGRWETLEAESLLSLMREISPDDPVLGTLELERRRLGAQKRRNLNEA